MSINTLQSPLRDLLSITKYPVPQPKGRAEAVRDPNQTHLPENQTLIIHSPRSPFPFFHCPPIHPLLYYHLLFSPYGDHTLLFHKTSRILTKFAFKKPRTKKEKHHHHLHNNVFEKHTMPRLPRPWTQGTFSGYRSP
ncbi:unnamed protein product [Tuber melanosporum]|uniref:(Perigord truffle) hypothetical protein n=1 Tax=Tuber melanosporum (strain Mel28) TaxID=656061 RepID=D5G4D1_TUBMM|nr:uncharacterized protein GSTUM_00004055001 [Tuber melanosporum]CAZ79374.1 unnamed protein product [Tuber melanosporum]